MQAQAAIGEFESLFCDEKIRGNRERWKEYFLSDTFLDVQFSEEFVGQMQVFLINQEFVPYDELPPYFIYELIVAYGLESFIDVRDCLIHALFMDEEHYECDMPEKIRQMSKSMKSVAEIWNGQDEAWRIQRGGRTIRKWEYRLRSRAFEDYIQICKEYECGESEWEKDEYGEGPFARGKWCYIQEGRCKNIEYGEFIRNECILKLYDYFLRTREVSVKVCVWLYNIYDFEGMSGKSYEEKYEGIRKSLFSQYSDLEVLAKNNKDNEERKRKWFLRLYDLEKRYRYNGWAIKPIMPYYYTYALSLPVVTKQEREELKDIIAAPVFVENKFDETFIDDLENHWVGGNATLGMTEAFFDAYMQCYIGDKQRLFTHYAAHKVCDKNTADDGGLVYSDMYDKTGNVRIIALLEYIRARLSYYKRIPEYMCYESFRYDLSMDSADFWYYYLMKAFEGWYVETEISDDDSYIEHNMIEDGKKYLSGYIHELYQPSLEWRRRFVGSDKFGNIEEPKRIEIVVLMEVVVTIEFHLHYIRFYLDGEPCDGRFFSFRDLLRYAGKEGQEKRFMLLLALTYIEEWECEEAYYEIRKRLEKLPIDAFCLEFVAGCLSGGKVFSEISSPNIIYMENLKTCYCAEIYSSGIVIRKNTPRGWRIEDPWFSTDATDEEIRNEALYGLSHIQNKKKKIKSVAVDGMSNLEKAERIIELLKESGKGVVNNFNYNKLPDYVKSFLQENLYLNNNSVTLVYGNQDSSYFEKQLNTGIYSVKDILADTYEVTRKEKSFKAGWLFQDWNLQKTILYIGESGTIWYYKSLAKLAKAKSLVEVIAECYRLEEVTSLYIV